MHFRKIAPDIFQSKNFQTASILGKSNGPSGRRERGMCNNFRQIQKFQLQSPLKVAFSLASEENRLLCFCCCCYFAVGGGAVVVVVVGAVVVVPTECETSGATFYSVLFMTRGRLDKSFTSFIVFKRNGFYRHFGCRYKNIFLSLAPPCHETPFVKRKVSFK